MTMRDMNAYVMGFRSLPSSLTAATLPLLTAPLFQLLGALNAEVNGTALSSSIASQLSTLGSIALLSSAWISGTSLNHYDNEINRLLTQERWLARIGSTFMVHALLAVAWVIGTLTFVSIFNFSVLKDLGVKPLGVAAFEVTLMSLLGCAIGLAFRSGVFSVSFTILYALLLAPAVDRLVPAIMTRGIAPRLHEVANGRRVTLPLLFDVAYFLSLIVFFLGVFLLINVSRFGDVKGRQAERP